MASGGRIESVLPRDPRRFPHESMHEPLPHQRAAGIVIYLRCEAGVRFLLLRNRMHHTWGFPKGRAERNETALETAYRETLEETGIRTVRLHPSFHAEIAYPVRGSQGRLLKTVEFFLGEVGDDRVVQSHEHDDTCWAGYEDAHRLLAYPDLRLVLEQVGRTLGLPPV
jgi:8-oxo-dGTP pyrophosphatase MutT (NUDIX family)